MVTVTAEKKQRACRKWSLTQHERKQCCCGLDFRMAPHFKEDNEPEHKTLLLLPDLVDAGFPAPTF
jgi:hypothetical protein